MPFQAKIFTYMGVNQLMAGAGIMLLGNTLIPQLSSLFS
jgi:hypothetical protein